MMSPAEQTRAVAVMATMPDVELHLSPVQLLAIIGAVQLAMRHPNFPPTSADLLRRTVRGIQQAMPRELADLIALGWSREAD